MRRTLLAGAALAIAMTGTLCTVSAQADSPSAALPPTPLSLPAPGGKQPIGMTTLHLEDKGRADPWVPGEKRQLMVSLWYPAEKPSGTPAPP